MQSFSSASAAGLSSKRVRGAAGSGSQQVASCLVDGCKSDLSKCRDYHRRHKVCELHSKTPTVTIGGLEQRFCQQCSRFHSLGEFDEGKRSCRKRLEGHNRRRRKPPPDTYSGMNPGNFLSGGGRGGGRLLSFGSGSGSGGAGAGAPIIADGSGVWSAPALSGETSLSPAFYSSHSQHQLDMAGGGGDHGNNHHHRCPSSTTSSSSYNARPFRGRQFPFLQCPPEISLPPPAATGASSSSSGPNFNNNEQSNNNSNNNNNSQKNNMFCDEGLNQVIDQSGRRRALSLLSSSSSSPPSSHHGAPDNAANNASSVTPGIGFSRLIHGHPNPMAHVHHQVRPQQQQHHHHLVSAAGISYDGHHFPCSSSPQGIDHHQHHHFHCLGGGGGGGAFGFRSSNNQVDVFLGSTAGSDQGSSSASGSHQTLSFSWE